MELIDTHAHIADIEFNDDLPELIKRAQIAGVSNIICVASGEDLQSNFNVIDVIERFDHVWGTIGIHPLYATAPFCEEALLELAQHIKILAIGETGLDYYYTPDTKEKQQEWLRIHIRIAKQLNKPLIIHARSAGEDCLKILQEEHAEDVGGVFHCFAENADFAKKLTDINFLVSFTGVITFKKAQEVQEVARKIPLNQIMLETDAPFLAPIPYRGKRCEPSFIVETAKFLAELKGVSLEEVAATTTQTAKNFFKLP